MQKCKKGSKKNKFMLKQNEFVYFLKFNPVLLT